MSDRQSNEKYEALQLQVVELKARVEALEAIARRFGFYQAKQGLTVTLPSEALKSGDDANGCIRSM